METTPLDSLDAASFEERCGTDFELTTAGGPAVLHLEKVRLLGHRRAGASRDPFALDFRGPVGILLPQGIYRLSQAGTTPMEIFLVQVADKPEGSFFEAVFT